MQDQGRLFRLHRSELFISNGSDSSSPETLANAPSKRVGACSACERQGTRNGNGIAAAAAAAVTFYNLNIVKQEEWG
jgi:hypothetical protein